MDRISKNISYNESVKSATAIKKGIKNVPNEEQLSNMKLLADKIFQPLREHFKVSIGVSSFFRSKELNETIGGAKSSKHMSGEAIDLDADIYGKITNKEIFDWVVDNLEFDTIIWEFGSENNPAWVHITYLKNGNRNRKLRAFKDYKGGTHYSNY